MTLVAAGGDRPVNGTRGESLLGLDHHADRTVLSEYLPLRLYGPSAVSAVDRHTWVVVDLQKVAPGSSGDAMHRCTPLVFLLLAMALAAFRWPTSSHPAMALPRGTTPATTRGGAPGSRLESDILMVLLDYSIDLITFPGSFHHKTLRPL